MKLEMWWLMVPPTMDSLLSLGCCRSVGTRDDKKVVWSEFVLRPCLCQLRFPTSGVLTLLHSISTATCPEPGVDQTITA